MTTTPPPNLIEQLHAGCGGSLGCQLLHQRAAGALASMREALESAKQLVENLNCTAPPHIISAWGKTYRQICAALQDTPTLDGPNDGACIHAIARAMAEFDWVGEPVHDVWAELELCDQEYYLGHARIARRAKGRAAAESQPREKEVKS